MKMIISIEGMSCSHCAASVERALEEIDGVKAKVDLKSKTAAVKSKGEVSDEALAAAVAEAGFKAVSVEEK